MSENEIKQQPVKVDANLGVYIEDDFIEDDDFESNDSRKAGKDDRQGENRISIEGKTIYRIKVVHSNALEFCVCEDNTALETGEYVILPTKYGRDLGIIQGIVTNLLEVDRNEIVALTRKATPKDLKKYEENREKDKKAFDICKQKAAEHNLDMKLVSAHYLLDEAKILFFFTADARVDFRELVKDLVAVFRTRIELRQIGVRDESRVLGGVGMCGRGFCCNTITDRLKPVSIKMAKEQNLSLNSLKISGACGRLLCCLAYEYPFYKDIKDHLPSQGSRLMYHGNEYIVEEINIFNKKIILKSNAERVDIPFCKFYYDEGRSAWCVKG